MKSIYQEFKEWRSKFSLSSIKVKDVPEKFQAAVVEYQRVFNELDECCEVALHSCLFYLIPKSISKPKINNCTKCNGTGYIHAFRHIEKGKCFACCK